MTDPGGVIPVSELPGLIRAAVAELLGDRNRPAVITINELADRYWSYASTVHRPAELRNLRLSLAPLRAAYGAAIVTTFGPLSLIAVRQTMVDRGLALRTVNARVNRIKAMFRWAAEAELLPDGRHAAVSAVRNLRRGRTTAPAPKVVRPADFLQVYRTLPWLSRTVRIMVLVQACTGLRSGSLCAMRRRDIERGEVWAYRPAVGKGDWRGDEQPSPVWLGPRVQRLLEPFMAGDPEGFLFSPRTSMAIERAARRKRRKSKVQPSQRDRRRPNPKRMPRDHYSSDSYGKAVAKAIARARRAGVAVKPWHPHQLRHRHGSICRKLYGLEGAQAALNHTSIASTQIYAERLGDLARRAAMEMG